MSKITENDPENPKKWPTKIKCPVDETGRNSVTPSTIPNSIALNISSIELPYYWLFQIFEYSMSMSYDTINFCLDLHTISSSSFSM